VSGGQRTRSRRSTRRDWGWHRLEAEWADRLIEQAEVRPGQLVVEFGAGTGAVTRPLLAAGARVLAVELHPGRAETLRRRFDTDRLRVLELDALDFRLPDRPFRVVAAPPYGISSALIARLTHRRSRMRRADLVLQRAVVNRFADRPLGRFTGTRGMGVPRRAFVPPPKVDSAVLTLRRD